jgi:uncharacterized protein
MEESKEEVSKPELPFQNLFLLSGLLNGMNKFWMYAGTILFLVLGYILFQFVGFFPLISRLIDKGYSRSEIELNPGLLFDSTALDLDKNIILSLELGMFVFAFFGFLLGLIYLHRKTLTSVVTGFEKFRFNRFIFSFLLWSLLLIVFMMFNYASSEEDFKWNPNYRGILVSFIIMSLLMPLQTGLEEVVFRGYLLQGLALLFKNGIIPLVLTSLVFGFAHMSNPEVQRFGWQIMLPYYVLFALFMGSITLLDEGLELAFGIHFANNLVSSILISSPNSVIKTYSFFEIGSENPQLEMLAWGVMATLSFVVFSKKYAWKNYSLLIR